MVLWFLRYYCENFSDVRIGCLVAAVSCYTSALLQAARKMSSVGSVFAAAVEAVCMGIVLDVAASICAGIVSCTRTM